MYDVETPCRNPRLQNIGDAIVDDETEDLFALSPRHVWRATDDMSDVCSG